MMDKAPERIGLIHDMLGFALAHKSESDIAIHYVRADLVDHIIEAASSDAEQATFSEWKAATGSDMPDGGEASADWHAGYDAAINRVRSAIKRGK